ncbi:signal peptidase II [Corynebacterium urealyticum]|uniref:signal peptidase II n=1 Tax=Corynebacterium urealyticum TaxID=43771 RepID=UPI0011E7E235|nr:signal peptidase II [Corynebacterium urealyticum]TYR16222.1 signal peptidase II [Corynebacterium urealyticum]TYT21753.1 signal peptidase II [Corynebacterium urealyticum]
MKQQSNRGTRTGVALATLAVVVIVDQLSKWLAVATLPPREPVPVLGDWFRFLLVRNPGAAFSMGTDATIVLAFIQLIAVGVAVFLAFRARSGLSALTIGLIGGGAAGNLIDRIFREPGGMRGHVVDFFSFWNFAIFNVADIAINVGVVLYLTIVFIAEPRVERKAQE